MRVRYDIGLTAGYGQELACTDDVMPATCRLQAITGHSAAGVLASVMSLIAIALALVFCPCVTFRGGRYAPEAAPQNRKAGPDASCAPIPGLAEHRGATADPC